MWHDWVYAEAFGIDVAPDLRAQLRDGFGPKASGEDPFDSVMGALLLVAVLEGLVQDIPAGLPDSQRAIEGWILGRPA